MGAREVGGRGGLGEGACALEWTGAPRESGKGGWKGKGETEWGEGAFHSGSHGIGLPSACREDWGSLAILLCVCVQGSFKCACVCAIHVCLCVYWSKDVLMGSGISLTLSPLWFLTLAHSYPYPHPPWLLPLAPPPLTPTLPTNLISGMPHAEPSADTGAQCDSRAPPSPHPPPPILHHPRDLVCLRADAASLEATWRDAGERGVEWKGKHWKLEWRDAFYPSIFIILGHCATAGSTRVLGGWHTHVYVCMHVWVCLKYEYHATKAWWPYA